jgi:hypothetical protein
MSLLEALSLERLVTENPKLDATTSNVKIIMKTLKILSWFLVLAVITSAGILGQDPGQTAGSRNTDILNETVADCLTTRDDSWPDNCLPTGNTTVADFLIGSFMGVGVPVGVVRAPGDDGATRFDFKPAGLTLRNVLDAIVVADPRYEWSVTDGVVNLVPKGYAPPLLDVRLSHFKGSNSGLFEPARTIEQMPEVQARARELGIVDRTEDLDRWGFIVSVGRKAHQYTYECSDCSVREVLNATAKLGHGYWKYCEVESDGKRRFYITSVS